MLKGKTITVIIPAYNEAPRISQVLSIVSNNSFLDRVIVVDDGSQDETSKVAANFPVEIIRLPQNRGKGWALVEGIRRAEDSDIYLFIDADLIYLREEHLLALLKPIVYRASVDMTVGIFRGGRKLSDLAQKFFPFLNGQRAVRGEWVRNLPDFSWTRFGVEVFLTCFAQKTASQVESIPLWGISHFHKEEKYGPFLGFYHRLKMYFEVARAYLWLEKKSKIVSKVVEKESDGYAQMQS
ncbi:MAG: hypothetical protein PWP04_977 [Candidatus Atribacteria bacterium]|nr:hypothetical protein [Candidatus Atribacteria bacterium]